MPPPPPQAIDVEWTPMLKLSAAVGDVLAKLFPRAKLVPAIRPEDISQDPAVVGPSLQRILLLPVPARAVPQARLAACREADGRPVLQRARAPSQGSRQALAHLPIRQPVCMPCLGLTRPLPAHTAFKLKPQPSP